LALIEDDEFNFSLPSICTKHMYDFLLMS
jgi:hypothetical protein